MFNSLFVVAILTAYVITLLLVSWVAEKQMASLGLKGHNSITYALSLAVYCTTWTYYGSIGQAVSSGLTFLPVYLGPTLVMIIGLPLLRKLIALKNRFHITNIPDLLSARYGKSELLGALATLVTVLGIIPYIALQIKAVRTTAALVSAPSVTMIETGGMDATGILVVGILIIATIVMGIRKLDPTERHPGMMMMLAAECMIKLTAFVTAAAFISFHLLDAPSFRSEFDRVFSHSTAVFGRTNGRDLLLFLTYFILSASAVIFLPRQFHVAIVENTDVKHIRTASWLFPAYLLLISIFVLPVAVAGLRSGLSPSDADMFLLALPLRNGHENLALFVFLGGFSAAAGMVMVEAMAVSTMTSNHLLLPLINRVEPLRFLKRQILQMRWIATAFIIIAGYFYELAIGNSYALVQMGMISFAAFLQFAPATLGGLFWRRGNKTGALLGLIAGFSIWLYTLVVPAFARSGIIPIELLHSGPLGIEFLRPNALFGVDAFHPLTHSLFWTMLGNCGFYIFGSVFTEATAVEKRDLDAFVGTEGRSARGSGSEEARIRNIARASKQAEVEKLLTQYFKPAEAQSLARKSFAAVGVAHETLISAIELAEVHAQVEHTLAGSIGPAAAFTALENSAILSRSEAEILTAAYGEILASLKLSPAELKRKIDYHVEREVLLARQSEELQRKLDERDRQNRELNRELINTARIAGKAEIATNVLHNVGNVLNSVNISATIVRDRITDSKIPRLLQAAKLIQSHQEDLSGFFRSEKGTQVLDYLQQLGQHLQNEQSAIRTEMESLCKNVEHIKMIVKLQQTHAVKTSGLVESVRVGELIDEAINIHRAVLGRRGIQLEREVTFTDEVSVDKHKVLQILVNLIGNACHACAEKPSEECRILVKALRSSDGRLNIQVIDNGIGIPPENLTKIFQHGFSTKKSGHGFGLHSGALAAKEMGGALIAQSAGPGKGAVFTLDLPPKPPSVDNGE